MSGLLVHGLGGQLNQCAQLLERLFVESSRADRPIDNQRDAISGSLPLESYQISLNLNDKNNNEGPKRSCAQETDVCVQVGRTRFASATVRVSSPFMAAHSIRLPAMATSRSSRSSSTGRAYKLTVPLDHINTQLDRTRASRREFIDGRSRLGSIATDSVRRQMHALACTLEPLVSLVLGKN